MDINGRIPHFHGDLGMAYENPLVYDDPPGQTNRSCGCKGPGEVGEFLAVEADWR